MDGEAALVTGLDPVACRVLGSLIEKERATPQNYPLTLNALRLACNQSTNRDPVVDYDDHTVETSLGDLRERRLIRIVYSQSNRAAKYRHVLDESLHLAGDELAALCVLLVRGPQTAGEIKGRSERLFPFTDLPALNETLDRLIARESGALVARLDRQPGQKDARYVHLLGDPDAASRANAASVASLGAPVSPATRWGSGDDLSAAPQPASGPPPGPGLAPGHVPPPGRGLASGRDPAPRPVPVPDDALVARVVDLERRLTDLRAEFEALRAEFD